MTLHVLRADESIAVTPGGRVRIVAPPARASTSARDPSGGDGDDSIDVGGRLHGYVVRGEVTETPALICRGLVEGTTWEELHADLASLEDDGNGDEDDVTARWLLRRPSHGGCFLVAALDKHRTFRLRTDTLGRCPVLVRDFGEGKRAWILGSTPGGDAPHVRDGWRCHHPRHILTISPTGAMDPTSTVHNLPLIPNNMEPCTSGTDALLRTDGPGFDTGDDDRCPNEGVLTVGEDPEWDEGMVSLFYTCVYGQLD